MVMSILTPYLPISTALFVWNVKGTMPLRPFNYDQIHNRANPYPWNSILLLPSDQLGFVYLNHQYISILTAIPVFVFFGMTKDAMNDYRRALLSFGLGKVFPRLHQEYDPDSRAYADSAYGSQLMGAST